MLNYVIILLILCVSTPAFCGPNLIKNGGFEQGDGGWNGKQPGTGKVWECICGGAHPEIYSLDSKVKHSGRFSQRMDSTGYHEKWVQEGVYCYSPDESGNEVRHPMGLGLGNQAIAQGTQPGSVTPGKNYRLSAWVKIEGVTDKWEWFRLGIYWLDKDGKFLSETRQDSETGKSDIGNHDWKRLTVDATAPANASIAKIYLHHHFTHGTVWYDDVWFGEVSEKAASN
jgi:hypothetical protein